MIKDGASVSLAAVQMDVDRLLAQICKRSSYSGTKLQLFLSRGAQITSCPPSALMYRRPRWGGGKIPCWLVFLSKKSPPNCNSNSCCGLTGAGGCPNRFSRSLTVTSCLIILAAAETV